MTLSKMNTIMPQGMITLRATSSAGKAKGVDKENRTMSGVVIVQEMSIKDYRGSDYGLSIDKSFVADLVKFAKKQKGVMANFGHNYNNLGRRLGTLSNFEIDGTTVYADLSVFKAADNSPGLQGLGSYVLDLAAEDASTMMFSIRFSYKYLYQRDSGGTDVKCYFYNKTTERYIEPNPELGAVYFKFESLASVDIVDEGAATNSLFSNQSELRDALAEMLEVPGAMEIAQELMSESETIVPPPTDTPENKKRTLLQRFMSLIGQESGDDTALLNNQNLEIEMTQEELTALNARIAASEQTNTDLSTQLTAANETIATQAAALTTATDALTALTSRIDVLEKLPAGKHTSGDEQDEELANVPVYMRNPINAAFAKNQQAKGK